MVSAEKRCWRKWQTAIVESRVHDRKKLITAVCHTKSFQLLCSIRAVKMVTQWSHAYGRYTQL